MQLNKLAYALAAAGLAVSGAALATNGMNLEGYGPIALGMGGAGMAYDSGNAAMMINPATLGLIADGTSRLDLAVGGLHPDVSTRDAGGQVDSDATAFYMPAVGYSKRVGNLTYGIGVYGQGGMGAEYKAGSTVDDTMNPSFGGQIAAPTLNGQKQRSELGVGRAILPLSYNVNDKLTIGGSVDLVWGGLDILWSADTVGFFGALDQDKVTNASWTKMTSPLGFNLTPGGVRGSLGGSLIDNFIDGFDPTNASPNPGFADFYWGTFKFNNGNPFTQKTLGWGAAGKLGMVYKAADNLSIGLTYHSKTQMKDFEGDATMTFKVTADAAATAAGLCPDADGNAGNGNQCTIDVSSKVKVKDFQWPETYGIGMAWQANDRLMLAADYKRVNWSKVMKTFHMVFTADAVQANPYATGFASTVLDYEYFQSWKDQHIYNIGGSYKYNDSLTLRAGYNYASSPVPSGYANFLFPATVEQHLTLGFGYALDKASELNFAFSHARSNTVTESQVETLVGSGADPQTAKTIEHSQNSWQIMYSKKF